MSKTVHIQRKKKKQVKGNDRIRCPYCGAYARYQSADGIYRDNSRNVMLYVCPNYPECDSYVRVHEGTKIPVGSMANPELRRLRNEAHKYFNRLYLNGYMTKDDAYRWLADIICTTDMKNAHIGNMSEYYCRLVIEKSREFIKQREQKGNVKRHDRYEKRRDKLQVIGGGRSEIRGERKAVS